MRAISLRLLGALDDLLFRVGRSAGNAVVDGLADRLAVRRSLFLRRLDPHRAFVGGDDRRRTGRRSPPTERR